MWKCIPFNRCYWLVTEETTISFYRFLFLRIFSIIGIHPFFFLSRIELLSIPLLSMQRKKNETLIHALRIHRHTHTHDVRHCIDVYRLVVNRFVFIIIDLDTHCSYLAFLFCLFDQGWNFDDEDHHFLFVRIEQEAASYNRCTVICRWFSD